MKTLPFITSLVLAAGVLVSVAAAQNSTETAAPPSPTFATPSTPAPAVSAVAAQAQPAPDRIIYVPRLPTAAELSNVAKAQGVTIDQIEQTSADVTITYRFADGRTSAVAYQLLPEAGTSPAIATTTTPAPAVAIVGRTAPTVVYYQPTTTPRVVYYDRPAYYYDPFYYPWYGPVSFSLGVGYGFYGHGHGYHGGGHYGGRGGHGGHGHW